MSIFTELHEALVGMRTIRNNTLDSSSGLFGVVEQQYRFNLDTVHAFLTENSDRYTLVSVAKSPHQLYTDTYLDRNDDLLFDSFRKKVKGCNFRSSLRVRHRGSSPSKSFQMITSDCGDDGICRKTIYHHTMDTNDPLLTHTSLDFFNGVRASVYHQLPGFIPIPALTITFERVILYNKVRNERINIDYNHIFSMHGQKTNASIDGYAIVESKSLDGWSSIDQYIKQYDIKPLPYTSKYTLGRALIEDKKIKGTAKRVKKLLT